MGGEVKQKEKKTPIERKQHHVLGWILSSRGVSFQVARLPIEKTPFRLVVAEGHACLFRLFCLLLHYQVVRRNHQDFSSATARATSLVAIFSQCRFASSSTVVGSFTSS